MLYFRSQQVSLPQEPAKNEGIFVHDLPQGAVVEIATQEHVFRLVKDAEAQVRISGHPQYFPEPVQVVVEGSVARGCPLAAHSGFIGLGMYLVLKHPRYDRITTPRILQIHQC